MYRFVWLIVALSLLVGACRGCNKAQPCEEECAAGEVCLDGACVAVGGACPEGCAEGEVCQAGACVSLEAQCETLAEECDPSLPVREGFYCLDLDGPGPDPGLCVDQCGTDGMCDPGALCFLVSTSDDSGCTANADCPDGYECAQGACRQAICRPSECEGFLEGIETCDALYGEDPRFAAGTQCYHLGNEARYCYPAGTMQEGDSCASLALALQTLDFSNTCASGLACIDSVCRVACTGGDQCGGDQDCVLADQDLVGPGTGFCGKSCTPFESGECGEGLSCYPVDAQVGVCVEAGDNEAFEPCTPGAGECSDGNVCVIYDEANGIARCQPMCNVAVAPANDDGTVGEFAQQQRDATCPQPPQADTHLMIVNLAELGQAVDVYLDDAADPLVAELPFEGRSDADAQDGGDQFLVVEPGSHTLTVLPAGAPRTDPPLHETMFSLSAEDAKILVLLPVAGTPDEASSFALDADPAVDVVAGQSLVRVVHALADADRVDVVVVPAGDDLSDPSAQTELATGLGLGESSAFVELAPGLYDLLVFPADDPREDRASALLEVADLELVADTLQELGLRGTLEPDDLAFAGATAFSPVFAPAFGASGPRYTCVDLGNEVFGACQQQCGEGAAAFGSDFCQGEGMGCHPQFLDANVTWQTLCAPLGQLDEGEPCNPRAEFGQCGEGLYCLEYGNTATNYDSARRGRCTSLCVVEEPDAPTLGCNAEQACQPLVYDGSYGIGRCGYACEPDDVYADAMCPSGLGSCKPVASLQEDLGATGDAPPLVQQEQPFCSAAGDIAAGEQCAGADCEPGTECMFPRSEQQSFVGTLLSQYFGGPGLVPTCTPQCDPFDGDGSAHTCADDETCLFNYPWSAEVGHCATIAEQRQPLETCSFPGQACGEDSICVLNGGANVCFQFCQYRGPGVDGGLQRETCATGMLCNPLVSDIGVCLEPR